MVLMVIALLIIAVMPVWSLVAAASSPLRVTAIQTASSTSAGEEYIELTNISTATVSVDSVRLEYVAAANDVTRPSRTVTMKGSVDVGQTIVLSSTGYRTDEARAQFSPTLAAAGGHIRIMNATIQWDLVGWGTAQRPLGSAAIAPAAGEVLVRKQIAGVWQHTDNNANDFQISGQSEAPHVGDGIDTASVIISEIFPDPVAPQTDAADEFIELFNTTDSVIHMQGLTLVVGTTTIKKFALPAMQIEPRAYRAFFAPQTKLTLSNSGGRVALQRGSTVLQEVVYPKAVAGRSWSLYGVEWQWTTKPTPNEANSIIGDQSAATSTSGTKKSATKKSTAKKPKASKAAKKGSVEAAATSTPSVTTTTTRAPVHTAVVAGVGGVAVLYGAYEYRYDALNLFRKLRRNREDR